ncbi:sucA [Symbiodinium necroappetens]|uniref:SucA protein n=1 Tax=Symbiodinium necroappetens TaxID=1628268 RepID=A0A812LCG7_9DINO|nr:sucA [Symbiodinium necroappetens]
MFTQPLLYKEIKNKPSVLKTYAERLLAEKVISEADVEEIRKSLDENLDRAFKSVKETPVDPTPDPGANKWIGVDNAFSFDRVNTAVHLDDLLEISRAMGTWPSDFKPHPKLAKLLEERATCVPEDKPLDWGTAETLAVGSLLIQGVITRFSGQDSRRGTFSHRHAVIRDYNTAEIYCPLNHIREMGIPGTEMDAGTVNDEGKIRQAKYCIYDSPLSEYAVLGFEYGFSLASPNMLVVWEAQFGDFSNGAQVVFDQFIASAEAKWHRWSGLVCLLPHGYEGQGPEHSSARLERFLKLCGKKNIQVCNPTTPAQMFHMLRRQVLRKFRKPLIVMSPKSLLRLPACTSRVEELTSGSFREILDDPTLETKKAKSKVRRVLLCSGKVYYDLDARRNEIGRDDIAIVRIEQMYPFHTDLMREILESYPEGVEVFWVQEEPQNMGAWGHMHLTFYTEFGRDLPYIGRQTSPTPATGSPTIHRQQLDRFLTEAVGALQPQEATA